MGEIAKLMIAGLDSADIMVVNTNASTGYPTTVTIQNQFKHKNDGKSIRAWGVLGYDDSYMGVADNKIYTPSNGTTSNMTITETASQITISGNLRKSIKLILVKM